jgi:hypothetical protein
LLLGAALASPAAAQIVTENAGVTSPELKVLRESVAVARTENLEDVRWNHELVFAPDRADEFQLTVPIVWREARFSSPGGGEQSEAAGLGDVSLRYKRALWRSDDVMRSERWALLFEVGAPTGEHDARENGVRVPLPLQLGTGDWTIGAGSAYTWIHDRRRFSVEAFYRHHSAHDGVQLGDSAVLNAAYWYRVLPAAFGPNDVGSEVRGVLEVLGSHAFASEVGGSRADDDGTVVSIAPGIQVFPSTRVLFEANVAVPVYQDIDDDLGDRRWSAVFAVKFLF